MQLPYIEKKGTFLPEVCERLAMFTRFKILVIKRAPNEMDEYKRRRKVLEEKVRAQKVDNGGQYDETDT